MTVSAYHVALGDLLNQPAQVVRSTPDVESFLSPNVVELHDVRRVLALAVRAALGLVVVDDEPSPAFSVRLIGKSPFLRVGERSPWKPC